MVPRTFSSQFIFIILSLSCTYDYREKNKIKQPRIYNLDLAVLYRTCKRRQNIYFWCSFLNPSQEGARQKDDSTPPKAVKMKSKPNRWCCRWDFWTKLRTATLFGHFHFYLVLVYPLSMICLASECRESFLSCSTPDVVENDISKGKLATYQLQSSQNVSYDGTHRAIRTQAVYASSAASCWSVPEDIG